MKKLIMCVVLGMMLSGEVNSLPQEVQIDELKSIHYDITVDKLSNGALYLEYLHYYQYYKYYEGDIKGIERFKNVLEEYSKRIEKEEKTLD